MMLSLLPTAVWAVNDEGSTSSGNGWPAGATGITVATEQYSAKDYEEDTTNVTHSDTIWYKIDGDTLTIGGKGAISDYSNTSELTKVLRFTQADWYKKKDTIKKVVIEDGITGIGTLAITNMTHLESIEIKGTRCGQQLSGQSQFESDSDYDRSAVCLPAEPDGKGKVV